MPTRRSRNLAAGRQACSEDRSEMWRGGSGQPRHGVTRTRRRAALWTAALALLIGGMALASCGSAPATSRASDESRAATLPPSPTTAPSPTPRPSPAACPPSNEAGTSCQVVPAVANIFGAGHDDPPGPGGGGAGELPPMWPVPPDLTIMRVEGAEGLVVPITGSSGANGAGGDMIGRTSVESWGGISGIIHPDNGMFLVGVFLTDDPPTDPAPERLSFNNQTENFEELAPVIAQTFFVGDGQGKQFVVPQGATRLFLGFADAYLYVGEPGWYGNNSGQLAVTVSFAEE